MADQKLESILKLIDKSLGDFHTVVGATGATVLDYVLNQLTELKIGKDGKIAAVVDNLKLMNQIRSKIKTAMMTNRYQSAVTDFAKTFNTINEKQKEYFGLTEKNFNASEFTNEVRKQMIGTTVNALTESGIGQTMEDEITELLRQNITSGSEYSTLAKGLRDVMLDNGTDPRMVKYAKQITVDSVNQYTAQNFKLISDDLGYEWYRYAGHDIDTTRPFCDAMTDREWFHVSEIPDLLMAKGLVYSAKDGSKRPVPIYARTGLPGGMIEGTTPENFLVRRGGYQCGHQILPSIERMVPQDIRDRVFASPAYKEWAIINGKDVKTPKAPPKPEPKPTPPPQPKPEPKPTPADPTPPPPPAKPKPSDEKIGSATTIDIAKVHAEHVLSQVGGVKVDSVRVHKDMTIERMNKMVAEMDRLFTEFNTHDPWIRDKGTRLAFSSEKGNYGVVTTYADHLYVTEINFGHESDTTSRIHTDEKATASDYRIRSKSRVDEKNIPIATVTHEFAHVISTDRGLYRSERINEFWQKIYKLQRAYKREIREIYKPGYDYSGDVKQQFRDYQQKEYEISLGTYANTNPREFMAEAFTEYQLSSNPTKYAKLVGEVIDEYFKKGWTAPPPKPKDPKKPRTKKTK